jgi:PKD repeat protein
MRIIVTTTDGLKSEAYIPVSTSLSSAQEGWRQVAIPLQAITGFDRTNKTVKSIAFSADTTTTFFVGGLGIVDDSTPIRGEANTTSLNLALGDEFEFTANGTGGSTPLKYTWNFDSASGNQVDAEGQTVTRKFRKAGEYTITLTISDVYGLKTPYVTTIKAIVNP